MGIRFRKSKKIGPFRVTLSKSGLSTSVGVKGFRVTKMANGRTRATISIPGTGISYVKEVGGKNVSKQLPKQDTVSPGIMKKAAPEATPENASRFVVETGRATVADLHREFQIDYASAARLMDQLEKMGVVGPYRPDKPREVLLASDDVPESETLPETEKVLPEKEPKSRTRIGLVVGVVIAVLLLAAVVYLAGRGHDLSASAQPLDSPSAETTKAEVFDRSLPVDDTAATSEPSIELPPVPVPEPTPELTQEAEPKPQTYVLNISTNRFHYPNCKSVSNMKEKNMQIVESTREDLITAGYDPCDNCHP